VSIVFLILLYICLGNFLIVLQVGLVMHHSLFTHTHYAYHEWGLVLGSV